MLQKQTGNTGTNENEQQNEENNGAGQTEEANYEEPEEKGTKAELGINNNELSTTVENNVQFTINLFTNNNQYDLYKNPKFIIELPECITEINEINNENITLLNNRRINEQGNEEDVFTDLNLEQYVENGKKYIRIMLTGEQQEYTASIIDNIQIIIPAKLKTSPLLPTLDEVIKLYYFNENRTAYILDSDTKLGYGEFTKEIQFIAVSGILTETTITLGEEIISNLKGEENILSVYPSSQRNGTVKIIIVNNTDNDLENAKILGHSELLNQISISEGEVHYSQNIAANINDDNWTDNFVENSKSYYIQIENFRKGQTIEYTYNISIPEAFVETEYEENYNVLNNNNEKLMEQASKITVKSLENSIETSDMNIDLYTNTEKNSVSIENVEIGSILEYTLSLNNNGSQEKNIIITGTLPENVDNTSIDGSILAQNQEDGFWSPEENADINIQNNEIIFNVTLQPNEKKYAKINAMVDKFISNQVETTIKVEIDGEEYILRDIKNQLTPTNLVIESFAYKNMEEITSQKIAFLAEDEILYKIIVKNIGETPAIIEISSEIDFLLEVQSIKQYYQSNENSWDADSLSNNFIVSGERLGENEELILMVTAKLYNELQETSTLESMFNIVGSYTEPTEIVKTYTVEVEGDSEENQETPIQPEEPEEPEEPEDPADPDNPDNQEEQDKEKYYTISGVAWLDKNQNGIRDNDENMLSGIGVELIQDDNIISGVKTNENGTYSFKDVEEGEYIIIFTYDTNKYKPTIPKQTGAEYNVNSDAYLSNIDEENIVRTDKLIVSDNIENIDIGLTEVETFELEIKKTISKITINNLEGTKIVNYKNEDFAKLEIPAKYYVGTNLIIEYDITIENIGDIAGYVYNVVDIIPEGMKFISELNPDWYEENGKLYSVSLSQEKINPQETASLKVVLTKDIEEDEAITIKNKAEILETFNDKLIKEKDVYNNISEAELIVSIKTGSVKTYIIITIVFLTIIATGAYVIKKKVLD